MKIYQNKHGMKAIVKDDGTAIWLNTLQPIYSKLDLTDWEECTLTEVAEIEADALSRVLDAL